MDLHQIAFLNRGKVKKAEAAKLILELAKDYPGAIPKLGLVLALHQPAAPKAATPFAWVAKATAPKDLRKYLQYVMCDGTNMVATDGSVCLVAPCTDRAPGLYDPKTGERVWLLESNYAAGEIPDGHPGKFPDWQRIMRSAAARALRPLTEVGQTSRLVGNSHLVGFEGSSWLYRSQLDVIRLRCDRVDLGVTPHVDSMAFEGPNGERAVAMPLRKNYLEKQGLI